jgi:hypothetical protein
MSSRHSPPFEGLVEDGCEIGGIMGEPAEEQSVHGRQ